MTKPLKISEEAAVQMPMKTVASLIAMIAVGTWAYFGIHEKLNQHSTKIELMLIQVLHLIQTLLYWLKNVEV